MDAYLAEGVFWVPEIARWDYIAKHSKQAEIGQIVDSALDAIEKENDSLRGVLPKNYSRPELDKRILGEIIDLFTNINVGGKEGKEKDILGRVYEYFLGKFAANEGKGWRRILYTKIYSCTYGRNDSAFQRICIRPCLWKWRYVCSIT